MADMEYDSDDNMPDLAPLEETWKSIKEIGDNCYKTKNYRGAIGAYSRAIAVSPKNATLYSNRAAAELMALQFQECIRDCDTVLSLEPTTSKAYFRKATAYKSLGRIEQAIESLKGGLVHEPTHSIANKDLETLKNALVTINTLKSSISTEGQCRIALPKIDRIIKDCGSNFRDANLIKVDCLLKLKKIEDAYNLTNTMMKYAANGDVELLHIRAKCFYQMGDLENSYKHLQSAMRCDPDNTTVRTMYRKVKEMEDKKEQGIVAFKSGEYQEAIDIWTEVLGIDTLCLNYNAKLYNNLATAWSKLKNHEKCITNCTKAIQIDREYIKAYTRRAESNLALGGKDRIQQSINDYEKIIDLCNEEEQANAINKKLKAAKVALKRAGRVDLYSILNCAPGANEDEIRKAYRKAALKYHPDKQAGKSEEEKAAAEAQFKTVGEAYEVLSDKEKRERYDSGVDLEDLDNPHAGHGGGGGGMGMFNNFISCLIYLIYFSNYYLI
jgi:DnaJ family protein C protein 7